MTSARRVRSRPSDVRLSFGAAGRGFSTAHRHSSEGADVEQHFGADSSGRVQHSPQQFSVANSPSFASHVPVTGTMLVTEIAAISAKNKQDFAEKRIIYDAGLNECYSQSSGPNPTKSSPFVAGL